MLLPRFLTVLIGVPVVLSTIYFGEIPFLFLILGIVALGTREFYTLVEEGGYACFKHLGFAGALLLVLSLFLNSTALGARLENHGTAALLCLLVAAVILRGFWEEDRELVLGQAGVTILGILYVAWTLGHLVLLRQVRPDGLALTYFLFLLIWIQDTMAYLIGLRYGRRALAQNLSPRKTWEGTIGGVTAAVIFALVAQRGWFRSSFHPLEMTGLAAAVSTVAVLSDLGESLLKRCVGVKESSTLLPGHGGILDRFDSFIFAAPLFYYYMMMVKHP